MICKSRKSKGIIGDNVTEKRFFSKNSFKLKARTIHKDTKSYSYHNRAVFLPQLCNLLTTAMLFSYHSCGKITA